MSELERELRKVYDRQDEAMRDQASRGSTREGVFEAGLRAALDHAVENLEPHLTHAEEALGVKLDGGSFLMGSMAAALALQGIDVVKAAQDPLGHRLFVEYIERARKRD